MQREKETQREREVRAEYYKLHCHNIKGKEARRWSGLVSSQRDEHNGEEESLCPSIFMWVRRGMNASLLSYWRVPDKDPIREHQQYKYKICTRAHVNSCHHVHTHIHKHHRKRAPVLQRCDVYDVGQWLLQDWHVECYCFNLPLTLNRPANTFTGHRSKHENDLFTFKWS